MFPQMKNLRSSVSLNMGGAENSQRRSGGRIDRRSFLAGGIRAGGAVTAASLGVERLTSSAAAVPGPYRRRRQPNILVIVVDELRAPRWYGAGPGGAPTLPPAMAGLERLGVSFGRHYTASNDCTPARSTMLTGLHTHQTGCMITNTSTLDPGFPTWGTMVRDHGYDAWWYGKWHLTAADDRWTRRDGLAALERYGFEGGTFPSPNGAPGQGWRVDGLIADQFDRWLEGNAGNTRPWCTTVSFVNPHDIAWWWRWSNRYLDEATADPLVSSLPPNFESPDELEQRGAPRVQRSLVETSAASFGTVPYSGPTVAETWLAFADLYVKLQLAVDAHIERPASATTRSWSSPPIMASTAARTVCAARARVSMRRRSGCRWWSPT
jgi:arylsulfatase A-like enzyme